MVMTFKSSPLTILRIAADLIKAGGAVHDSFRTGCRYCFLGAIWSAEGGDMCRDSEAYQYVIKACEELLPGWKHDVIAKATYGMDINCAQWETKLPEAILVRAHEEGCIDEIANIVMARAMKLAEADIISDGRVADEAEMIAQGGVREVFAAQSHAVITTLSN